MVLSFPNQPVHRVVISQLTNRPTPLLLKLFQTNRSIGLSFPDQQTNALDHIHSTYLTYANTYVIILVEEMIAMVITATAARQSFYSLLDDVNENSAPVIIQRKNNKNAVLLSESDWNAIQETLYLMSIPGVAVSVKEGMDTSLEECTPESEVSW